MNWHHRTIKHIHSTIPDEEVYYTVHEFYYDKKVKNVPVYDAFTQSPAYPCSKEEATFILKAYDYPPAVIVDDASIDNDEGYVTYAWLVPHAPDRNATDVKDLPHAATT